jgi:ATP-dependent helicase/nuclease subunit B
LRACPYRFFSRSILALGEADELDAEIEKRDYGSWLHAVLHAFHVARQQSEGTDPASPEVETSRLLAQGAASLAAEGLDEAGFLPFSSSFAAFAPRYIFWLQERERRGKRWSRGEVALQVAPPELAGMTLQGRIDRIDTVGVGGHAGLELIDYKTGSAAKLKASVRDRSEDTQLAFYAALVGAESTLPLEAMYLALDATHGLEEIPHRDVSASAYALVTAAADEFRRLREGAPLPPLGEGEACEHCEARGLCRRDHWSVAIDAAGADEKRPK